MLNSIEIIIGLETKFLFFTFHRNNNYLAVKKSVVNFAFCVCLLELLIIKIGFVSICKQIIGTLLAAVVGGSESIMMLYMSGRGGGGGGMAGGRELV